MLRARMAGTVSCVQNELRSILSMFEITLGNWPPIARMLQADPTNDRSLHYLSWA